MCNYCRMLCGGSMLSRTVWRIQFCSICGHHCRRSGQGGNGPRSVLGSRHQTGPYPRPQSAMLSHSDKIPPATIMATGTTTISTISRNQESQAEAKGGQLVPYQGFSRNPFICILCNNAFQNPCLLACYHTFCAACLRARISKEGKLVCPLCG